MSTLTVSDLHVRLPSGNNVLHAVRGIDFDIKSGETLCIVGESGCGKSMTALALMGLLPRKARRDVASLRFGDDDLAAMSERQLADLRGKRIAMIFQDPMTCLNPAYAIGNQLQEAYRLHTPNVTRKAAFARAVEMLEKVGIPDPMVRMNQYPHQLSGGLRQRVMIALGLMCGPELLIADEPTTALDVQVQAQILHLLAGLQHELGLSILMITHDLGLVARFAHRVAVMYAGRIVETGTVESVFRAPSHPYTRGLLDCIPVPGKTQRGQPLGSIPGTVPSMLGEMAGCAFRERCPQAFEPCARRVTRHDITPGHMVECNLGADAGARGASA